MMEIALRNKIDQAITLKCGAGWLENDEVLMDSYQRGCVLDARRSLMREQKTATHGQMISELNLGFWSSLFGKHSNHLWGQILRPIFNVGGLQRSTIAERLRNLRRLRNRVAHYEPILALPLARLHKDVLELSSWLSSDASHWIVSYTSVVYPPTPILVFDPSVQGLLFDRALVENLPMV
jgi:hypothetical protein